MELPQKVKLSGKASDFRAFNPKSEHIYKVIVEDTIEELRTLKHFRNVTYTKIVKQVTASQEDIPETTDLRELLVDKICEENAYDATMKYKTDRLIGGLLDEISS